MKKILVMLVVGLMLVLALVGCTDPTATNVPSNTPGGSTEAPTTEAPSATPTTSAEEGIATLPPATQKPEAPGVDENLTYKFDLDEMTMPIWQSNTIYNECITFHKDEAGNITAKLLFKPIQVISVRDNSLKIELKEGVHYKFDEKDPQTLIWLEGDDNFVIPYWNPGDLSSPHQDNCGTSGMGGAIGNIMYCVGEWLYSKQLAITYTYDLNDNTMPHAEYAGAYLPKTIAKLKNKEKLSICIYGDSIFTGCDSSSAYGREPKTPTFFKLLQTKLADLYDHEEIKLSNPSVGGWQADDGIENVGTKVARRKPDLVILGFGMNDSDKSGTLEAKKIQQIMDEILKENPNCEFIVVSTFQPTPAWTGNIGSHAAGFKTLEKVGVATMDMFELHQYILARKYYQDTTGNNINHPNDYLARIYAMQLLTMLYDYNAQ